MQTNPSCNTIAFLLKILCWILFIWSSVVMLNSLQARLQQYVNRELLDVQAGFRKGRGTRDQIANVRICIYIYIFFFTVAPHRTLNIVPVLRRRTLLTRSMYDALHRLFPNSQFFPPPSPTLATPSVLYVCESVCHRYIHLCCSLDSMYKWYMVLVSFWLSLLNMIIYSSSNVAPNSIIHSSHTKLFQYPICNS